MPLSLLSQDLLHLTDFLLNFAGNLFNGTFGFQLRIIAQHSGDLLDRTLDFVKRSFRLVPCTRFHDISPFWFRFYCVRTYQVLHLWLSSTSFHGFRMIPLTGETVPKAQPLNSQLQIFGQVAQFGLHPHIKELQATDVSQTDPCTIYATFFSPPASICCKETPSASILP